MKRFSAAGSLERFRNQNKKASVDSIYRRLFGFKIAK